MQFGSSAPKNTAVGVERLIRSLENSLGHSQAIDGQATRLAFEEVSLNAAQVQILDQAVNSLDLAIEAAANDLGILETMTVAQKEAGRIAGLCAGDYRNFMSRRIDGTSAVATENMAVLTPAAMGITDAFANRHLGLEAYDERENRNAMLYSITWNMQSAKQDEFGETIWPTITITPDNVGYDIAVNLMMVYDGAEHKINGNQVDFKKRNLIRAVVDSTILKKDQTRCIPVYRPENSNHFVPNTITVPSDLLIEGETIRTAPLAVNKKQNIIALSQTDALISMGVMTFEDTLDPTINVTAVYVKFGDDVVKFNVSGLPTFNFVAAQQGQYRAANLNAKTTSILMNKLTTRQDGSPLTTLDGIVTNDLIVRLEMRLSGDANTEFGDLTVFGNMVAAYTVADKDGQLLPMDSGVAKPIVDLLNAGEIVGFDQLSYRSNMNRRQRGQLIDTSRFYQKVLVPLRAPISTVHPINDNQVDGADVQALLAATRTRLQNEAVTHLIDAAQTLSAYVDSRDQVGDGPEVLGVGRYYVRPKFFHEEIDMTKIVDSVKSHERAQDMQAALVNKLRDYTYRMYRDSEYPAAASMLSGGIASVPEVIIATDPVLARYLNVSGDLRTLGGEFKVRIVSTLDSRMAGKIIMVFGVFDDTRNSVPNPLNFGNMFWAPEMVLNAQISRGNSTSRETVVQPRYAFAVQCPIMTVLSVSNVPDVINKVPLFIKSL